MDNVSHPSSKDPFTFIISIQCLMIDYIITNHPFLKFALFQRVSVCSSNVMTCYSYSWAAYRLVTVVTSRRLKLD